MSNLRFHAVKESMSRIPVQIEERERRSELFGSHTFNETAMRQHLSKDAYKGVMSAIKKELKLIETLPIRSHPL